MALSCSAGAGLRSVSLCGGDSMAAAGQVCGHEPGAVSGGHGGVRGISASVGDGEGICRAGSALFFQGEGGDPDELQIRPAQRQLLSVHPAAAFPVASP